MAEPEPQPKKRFETLAVEAPSLDDASDVILEVRLPRETLAVGAKVPVSFMRRALCATCAGRGAEADPPCTECERGYTKSEATVEVDVPPGAGPGMQLRVAGQGHDRRDRPRGDVIVVVAAAAEETSQAAQKLPSFIVLVVVTIIVLILALRLAR